MPKKVKINENSIFEIELKDGSSTYGIFHKHVPKALNSYICSFYNFRNPIDQEVEVDIKNFKPISVQFVSRESLDKKIWPIVKELGKNDIDEQMYSGFLADRESYKGVKIIGCGIIRKFLNAYFGFLPWDMMHDPNYFDKLLLPQAPRPTNKVLKRL